MKQYYAVLKHIKIMCVLNYNTIIIILVMKRVMVAKHNLFMFTIYPLMHKTL